MPSRMRRLEGSRIPIRTQPTHAWPVTARPRVASLANWGPMRTWAWGATRSRPSRAGRWWKKASDSPAAVGRNRGAPSRGERMGRRHRGLDAWLRLSQLRHGHLRDPRRALEEGFRAAGCDVLGIWIGRRADAGRNLDAEGIPGCVRRDLPVISRGPGRGDLSRLESARSGLVLAPDCGSIRVAV